MQAFSLFLCVCVTCVLGSLSGSSRVQVQAACIAKVWRPNGISNRIIVAAAAAAEGGWK